MKHYQLYTDDLLLTLLKKDDEQAFNEVYNRYWKILFSIASSRLRNIHAAEDIIHDVFASIWKNRKNSDIRSLQHYLASSTRYLVFKVIRKNAYAHQYTASGQDIITTFELENSLHNKYLLEYISREVDTLPEKCKMIFKYSREKGMTNKEIALEMNITSKTVENQINKALHHLRFSIKKMLMFFF
ncbi:MAG: RNA polymerase sigma-70 factor [Chitinophagaceae bacterium]|nr:RNA polymerase sigma-70 factor [Chitinophagaceae bacterium]